MKILSLAHNCETEMFIDKDGKQNKFYNGPSPDEVALVQFASSMNFDCIESNEICILMKSMHDGSFVEKKYTKFKSMDFTSDRKRMSVLIKDPSDNTIKLLVKGADSIIKERLDMSTQTQELHDKTEWFLDTASKQGLRTLLMAMRVVDEEEKDFFLAEVRAAQLLKKGKDKALDEIYSRFEQNLTLIGGTAVEDRLQDDVPETIASLQEAGIKIWMLTGDKLETAENIAQSCKLLVPSRMKIMRLANADDVEKYCTIEEVQKSVERVKFGK